MWAFCTSQKRRDRKHQALSERLAFVQWDKRKCYIITPLTLFLLAVSVSTAGVEEREGCAMPCSKQTCSVSNLEDINCKMSANIYPRQRLERCLQFGKVCKSLRSKRHDVCVLNPNPLIKVLWQGVEIYRALHNAVAFTLLEQPRESATREGSSSPFHLKEGSWSGPKMCRNSSLTYSAETHQLCLESRARNS